MKKPLSFLIYWYFRQCQDAYQIINKQMSTSGVPVKKAEMSIEVHAQNGREPWTLKPGL